MVSGCTNYVDLHQHPNHPVYGVQRKNTIGDGGSTARLTAYAVDSVDTVDTAYTVYTIETALHCLDSSTYAYINC